MRPSSARVLLHASPVPSCPAYGPNSNDCEYPQPFRHISTTESPALRPIATWQYSCADASPGDVPTIRCHSSCQSDSLGPVPRFAETYFPASVAAGVEHLRVKLLLLHSLCLISAGIALHTSNPNSAQQSLEPA